MRKVNKQRLILLGLFILLLTGTAVAARKFILLTLGHTVYYCQRAIGSLSVQIPQQLGIAFAGVLTLIIIASAVKILLAYVSVYRKRKSLAAVLPRQKNLTALIEKLSLANQVFLVNSSMLSAFCFGIRSPKIYLSSALVNQMDSKQLEAVVRHERYHLENRDSLTLLIAQVTQSLFPFFPFISDLIYNFRIEREVRADREVVTALGESKTLISVLQKFLEAEAQPALAFSPALGDSDTLEPRIKTLLQNNFTYRKFNPLNIFVSLLTVFVIGLVLIVPVRAVEIHEPGGEATMICLSDDTCAKWCQQNNTIKPYSEAENASHFTP